MQSLEKIAGTSTFVLHDLHDVHLSFPNQRSIRGLSGWNCSSNRKSPRLDVNTLFLQILDSCLAKLHENSIFRLGTPGAEKQQEINCGISNSSTSNFKTPSIPFLFSQIAAPFLVAPYWLGSKKKTCQKPRVFPPKVLRAPKPSTSWYRVPLSLGRRNSRPCHGGQ